MAFLITIRSLEENSSARPDFESGYRTVNCDDLRRNILTLQGRVSNSRQLLKTSDVRALLERTDGLIRQWGNNIIYTDDQKGPDGQKIYDHSKLAVLNTRRRNLVSLLSLHEKYVLNRCRPNIS